MVSDDSLRRRQAVKGKVDHSQRQAAQLCQLQALLTEVLSSNPFYAAKLRAAGVESADDVATLQQYTDLPFTTKQELSVDQAENPPYGTNLTYPAQRYVRVHQTSGTTGERLRWLDTEDSWTWFGRGWEAVYGGAGVTGEDRIFLAASFGPFIGFWSAHEGARLLGAMAIPGGGMSSVQRLEALAFNKATVLVCTPTYALHLAEVAAAQGLDLVRDTSVHVTIHAGEPGAGLPATKARIEQAWGARCFDHAGATEVGAWGFECTEQDGLHLNEDQFIFEIIDPQSDQPANEGELVITNLGRTGMPVIRYRTGDRVRWHEAGSCACGRTFRRLEGGVIGRLDDALVIRGINVYPSLIENVVRGFPQVGEFAVHVRRPGAMDELEIEVEVEDGAEAVVEGLAAELYRGLALRPRVRAVACGSLPRFELKARRVTDHRQLGQNG